LAFAVLAARGSFLRAIFWKIFGTAHWAHVGGFAFGALGALALRYSGLEAKADAAIESKVTWTAAPAIVQATEQLEKGKLDDAIATLQTYLASNPESVEGYTLLPQIYWRKNNVPAYRDAMAKLIQLHLKTQNFEAAWQDFQDLKNSGAETLPAAIWLELGRAAEGQGNFERAVEEYGRLAAAFPNERPALLASLSAGRLSLKNLNRPADALRFYETAANRPCLIWIGIPTFAMASKVPKKRSEPCPPNLATLPFWQASCVVAVARIPLFCYVCTRGMNDYGNTLLLALEAFLPAETVRYLCSGNNSFLLRGHNLAIRSNQRPIQARE